MAAAKSELLIVDHKAEVETECTDAPTLLREPRRVDRTALHSPGDKYGKFADDTSVSASEGPLSLVTTTSSSRVAPASGPASLPKQFMSEAYYVCAVQESSEN